MPARVMRFSELTEDGGGSFQAFSSGYLLSVALPKYFTALTSSNALVGTRAGMNPLLVYSNAISDPSASGNGRNSPVSALLITSIFLVSKSYRNRLDAPV